MGHAARIPAVAGETAYHSAAPETGEPVIDLIHLSRQTLGDSALETELLSLFERQAQQLAQRLAEPSRPEESKWRADLAHTLNGSARAIGAVAVSRAAQAYENAARAGAPDLDAHFFGLDAAISAARSTIAQLLDRAA